MAETDHYQQAPGTTVEEDEVGAAVRVGQDDWLVLSPTAVAIWRALEQRSTVGQIVATLEETYVANADQIREDVVDCLEGWQAWGLITCERS